MWDQRQLEVPASGDLGKDKAMFWRTIQVFIFERSCKLSGDWHGTNLNQVVSGNCAAETQKLEVSGSVSSERERMHYSRSVEATRS